jgi:hypothetical protein
MLKVLGRPGAALRGVFLVAAAVLLAYWLTPLFQVPRDDIVASDEYRSVRKATLGALSARGQREVGQARVRINPFVDIIATVTAVGVDRGPEIIDESFVARPRIDNLILLAGTLTMLLLVTRELRLSSVSSVSLGPESLDLEPSVTGASARQIVPESAEGFLTSDVQTASRLTDALYRRSTLLLVGGILMAFIGVGISRRAASPTTKSQFDV